MPNPNLEQNTIRATYRITTPMFCGGAEQQAEFRLASFKGVLRFWWRALEWGRLQDLAKLRQEEAELFGSSDEGQSSFLMRLTQPPTGNVIDKKSQLKDGNELVGEGARYLGYGVMEAYERRDRETREIKSRDAELIRPCLRAPDEFGLAVRFIAGPSGANETQRKQIVRALTLAGLLAGMGSKSRKGYGSLTLTKLSLNESEAWSVPKTLNEFHSAILKELSREGDGSGNTALPKQEVTPLTAFAAGFRIVAIEGRKGESALKLLDRIGREMVRFRSWGRSQRGEAPRVLHSVASEKNFQPDHDLMRVSPVPAELRGTHPQRIAFGLPHNYGQRSQDQVEPANTELSRRASPLFIHIHEPEGSPPIGVLTFLPSMFLPSGRDQITVGGKQVALQTKDFWKPVTDFLDRLLDPSARSEEFTKEDRVVEVARG